VNSRCKRQILTVAAGIFTIISPTRGSANPEAMVSTVLPRDGSLIRWRDLRQLFERATGADGPHVCHSTAHHFSVAHAPDAEHRLRNFRNVERGK
jgi:hypothetical protein